MAIANEREGFVLVREVFTLVRVTRRRRTGIAKVRLIFA
jgi:hypothetical protein